MKRVGSSLDQRATRKTPLSQLVPIKGLKTNSGGIKGIQTSYARSRIRLAIFGGHTSSSAVAYNKSGILGVTTGPGLHTHLYPSTVLRTMLMTRLLDPLRTLEKVDDLYDRTEAIAISCAGAAAQQDVRQLRDCLEIPFADSKPRIRVFDDTVAGLIAGTLSLSGTCAVAGTGASVTYCDGKQPKEWGGKVDGWGYIIGDFGSGFQLTVRMFREFCRYWNRHNTEPPLFREVKACIAQQPSTSVPELPLLSSIEGTQQWFDDLTLHDFRKDWRVRFARLAAVATKAAQGDQPDALAIQLVEESANDIIDSARIVYKNHPRARNLPVTLHGGMFEHSPLYREKVISSIANEGRGKCSMSRYRVIVGAMLLQEGKVSEAVQNSYRIEKWLGKLSPDQRKVLLREDDGK